MDILLIGGISSFMRLLVDKLAKEGHKVYMLTEEKKENYSFHKVFEAYHFEYNNVCIREVFESVRPDVSIFTGAYDTNFIWDDAQNTAVKYSSGLMNILLGFAAANKGRFIYLSSEEVYQKSYAYEIEEEEPYTVYTQKGQALAIGEEMCLNYQKMLDADIVVLRFGHMYSIPGEPAEMDKLCAKMCMAAIDTGEITINVQRRNSMIYASDAVEFIYKIASTKRHDYNLYQISSLVPVTEEDMAKIIQNALGGSNKVKIAEENSGKDSGIVFSSRLFADEFGIQIRHTPVKILPELAKYLKKNVTKFSRLDEAPRSFVERLKMKTKGLFIAAVPFIENLVLFIPFFMLNNRATGSQFFSHIDFYLLYVLLFAIVHGQQQAIFSSLLAVAGYCFRQMYNRTGFDVLLDYNTYIWIAQLMILGLVVGYMRDELRMVKEEDEHEIKYLSGQLDDISDINVSNVRVKEILSDQLVNQNDSFGKIYEITSRLDKYEPEEVIFYAAEVLSKLMGSKDVAIYMVANRSYARLFSATSTKARSLGNSINYQNMGAMYESMLEKKVYINRDMDEQYPLMANAIYSEDEMQLILMVWGIPWERMTLGQANLLTIIGYLIQNAVIRATRYMSALEEQRYIQGTNILEEEAFTSLVRAYLNAKTKNLTECTLVSIDTGIMQKVKISQELSPLVRQTDYLGELKDGKVYALLSNTSTNDAEFVRRRFIEKGFPCQIEEDVAI